MDKIRVALICNGYGMVKRGAEESTRQFYDNLKNDMDIDVYGMHNTDHSKGMYTKNRGNIRIPHRNLKNTVESLYFGRAWYNYVIEKRKKYDLVYNNAGIGGSFWCLKYRNETKTPFITRTRGLGKIEILQYLLKPDMIEFRTKQHEEESVGKLRKIVKRKTCIIPLAIDLEEFRTKPKDTKSLTKGLSPPIFLGTSSLVKFKRNELIIKAVSKLDKGSLVLAGDGAQRKYITELGRNMLGDRFRYVGNIEERSKLVRLYYDSDVFVSASVKETIPRVCLEAMATGAPVVVQYNEKRVPFLNNCAIFVKDCRNIDEFSSKLREATTLDLGEKPLEQIEKFSWDNIKKQYIKLFERVSK